MKTPELPPIEYRPTFRLDSSGLVVGTATQEEWDAAVARHTIEKVDRSKFPFLYPQVQCWKCKEILHTRAMDYHVCSAFPVEKPAACVALENVQ